MSPFKCPICSAKSFSGKVDYRAASRIFADRHIIQCNVCHTAMVHPLPIEQQLDHYYHDYWKRETLHEMLPLFEAQAAARFEFFRPFIPKRNELRVLDIGAGFGLIYNVMSNVTARKIAYSAVEMDPLAVDYLRTHIKPRVVYNRQEEVRGTYDVILLSHIIEHMVDPVHFLKNLTQHVHGHGILFIEVPNQDHKFKSLNEPHLFFFDRQTISNLAVHAGYEVLRVDICGPQMFELQDNNRMAIAMKNFLRRKIPHYMKKSILRIRSILFNRGSLAGIAKEAIFDYNSSGRWIRLVALKKDA